MLVADTSALVSLAIADLLDVVTGEFDVHTTETVLTELEETAAYDDAHGEGARRVLDRAEDLTVTDTEDPPVESARIDEGEASCLALERAVDADFLLTDDLRALPELQTASDAQVAISPFVIRALVKREVLDTATAKRRLERLAETRGWLGAPIYRRAQRLFDPDSRDD